jgi:hypothetical protein
VIIQNQRKKRRKKAKRGRNEAKMGQEGKTIRVSSYNIGCCVDCFLGML